MPLVGVAMSVAGWERDVLAMAPPVDAAVAVGGGAYALGRFADKVGRLRITCSG
jgi:hypothetical protein